MLRGFPVRQELEGETGVTQVDWGQTLGKIRLVHRLSGGPHDVAGGWRKEDIELQMSKTQMKVLLGGTLYKILTVDFTVRCKLRGAHADLTYFQHFLRHFRGILRKNSLTLNLATIKMVFIPLIVDQESNGKKLKSFLLTKIL